jgi:hypothetical protein
MEPIVGVGGRLAPKPPSFSRKRIYTPKRRDNLCIFACIKKALGVKGLVTSMAKKYANEARCSLRWLRKEGLNAPKPKWSDFQSSLHEHAARLENFFRIRLYLLVIDEEAAALRKNSTTRLSVLQVYCPQRRDGPIVHILLTDESKNPRSENVYTHAHLIKMDDTTLNGVRCGYCDKRFTQQRGRNKLHKCKTTGGLWYPGGLR